MKLADEIQKAMEVEVRASEADEYFEAVFEAKDMEKLSTVAKAALGEPVKPPGKNVKLAADVEELVESMGGLRREQSFYFKKENGGYTYMALWPWQSNPSKITLKMGIGSFPAK